MRVLFAVVILGLVSACGRQSDPWIVELRDPGGDPVAFSETFAVVLFEPDVEPRRVLQGLGDEPGLWTVGLPPLTAGHYELWLPGRRPLRVDRAPTGPLQMVIGYPVDVEWRADVPVAAGNSIKVTATWRGPGDHPEAVLRTTFPSAAPAPGEHSPNWMAFVKGILIEPPTRTDRLYVPWPGLYRIKWGIGQFRIVEGPNTFNAFGGGSRSPADAIAVEVPPAGSAPHVEIPRR